MFAGVGVVLSLVALAGNGFTKRHGFAESQDKEVSRPAAHQRQGFTDLKFEKPAILLPAPQTWVEAYARAKRDGKGVIVVKHPDGGRLLDSQIAYARRRAAAEDRRFAIAGPANTHMGAGVYRYDVVNGELYKRTHYRHDAAGRYMNTEHFATPEGDWRASTNQQERTPIPERPAEAKPKAIERRLFDRYGRPISASNVGDVGAAPFYNQVRYVDQPSIRVQVRRPASRQRFTFRSSACAS